MHPTLNKKVLDSDVEQIAIRKGFGEGLLSLGESNPHVVGLCADLTESTQMHLFKNKFPDRFIEIGVAEQNLASVASGMAGMGKIPFISSYAMFSPGRNWEQIRTTIAYNDRAVVIVGSHAGVSVGPDGGTHQAIEDIAITRVIPNMIVLSPCDSVEAKKATLASAKAGKPVYLRLAREKSPVITTEDTPFTIGKAETFFESKKPEVAIIASGALVHKALIAAEALEKDGVGTMVVNLSTIKPLDEEVLLSIAKKVKGIVSVEEHQIVGGVGSALAEFFSQHHPLPQEFVGVRDLFGQSGTPEELYTHYGMDTKVIKGAVEKIIQRIK
jgi:transketolase